MGKRVVPEMAQPCSCEARNWHLVRGSASLKSYELRKRGSMAGACPGVAPAAGPLFGIEGQFTSGVPDLRGHDGFIPEAALSERGSVLAASWLVPNCLAVHDVPRTHQCVD